MIKLHQSELRGTIKIKGQFQNPIPNTKDKLGRDCPPNPKPVMILVFENTVHTTEILTKHHVPLPGGGAAGRFIVGATILDNGQFELRPDTGYESPEVWRRPLLPLGNKSGAYRIQLGINARPKLQEYSKVEPYDIEWTVNESTGVFTTLLPQALLPLAKQPHISPVEQSRQLDQLNELLGRLQDNSTVVNVELGKARRIVDVLLQQRSPGIRGVVDNEDDG